MLATGKQIIIKDGSFEITTELVPVMRNGKPTKRNKEVVVVNHSDAIADSYMIEGHEVYMIRKEVEEARQDEYYNCVRLFREDSSKIYADCTFGRTGTVNHKVRVEYNVLKDRIEIHSTGYDGPMGHGHGAYVKKINW